MSEIKVDTLSTVSGSGNLTVSNNIAGAGTISGTNITASGTLGVTGLITASAGVAIGGTGAVNTLDDYEEGTFTPTLSGGSGTITTQSTTGEYVKVGTVCFIHMILTLTDKGTASGTLFVSGLPFTSGTLRIPMISRENATTGVTEQFVVNQDNTTGFFKSTGGGNVTLANGNVRMVGGSYITV